jgi:hypothetical protein
MKLAGIHVNKLLASLWICIILLLSSLLPYTSAIAAPPLNDPTSGPGDGRVNLVSASSEEVIIDVRVDDFDAAEVTVKGTTYQRLSLHETAATQEIGKPELPIIGQFVAIPPGASLSIDIVDVDQSTLPGYMVYPAQEPPLDQGDWEEPPFTIDEGFYQQDTFYPAEYVTASAPQTMRDVTVVWLSIHPLQFNPARRELRFNKYMAGPGQTTLFKAFARALCSTVARSNSPLCPWMVTRPTRWGPST